MKQKTVRFYDDAPDDVCALNILNDCRKYGFNSGRELVIAAVNMYAQGGNIGSLGIRNADMDELADKIAMRIKNMNMTIRKEGSHTEKIKNENGTDNNENYQKALRFMETL